VIRADRDRDQLNDGASGSDLKFRKFSFQQISPNPEPTPQDEHHADAPGPAIRPRSQHGRNLAESKRPGNSIAVSADGWRQAWLDSREGSSPFVGGVSFANPHRLLRRKASQSSALRSMTRPLFGGGSSAGPPIAYLTDGLAELGSPKLPSSAFNHTSRPGLREMALDGAMPPS